ncbi:hypothetical protein ACQJBY_022204 [Aegilops geniculata]
MAPPSYSSAPPPSSWVILGSIPRVSAPAGGGDASLALAAPPRVSILNVSQSVFPAPTHHFSFVLAADPSGLLLLQANLSRPPRREFLDGPASQGVYWKDSTSRYFVLDATASPGTAFHLPDPEPPNTILHQALLGLLASPAGGGHYMVAELQPIIGLDKATLLCFSTEVGEWVEKRVHYPLPPRPLVPIGVVSHHGRLWWVDLSWGVIHCDPFADKPVLGFVPFPPERVLKCREGWGVTDEYRYVGVSDGKLRFVDAYVRSGDADAPKVAVWTLAHEHIQTPGSGRWSTRRRLRRSGATRATRPPGCPRRCPCLHSSCKGPDLDLKGEEGGRRPAEKISFSWLMLIQ